VELSVIFKQFLVADHQVRVAVKIDAKAALMVIRHVLMVVLMVA